MPLKWEKHERKYRELLRFNVVVKFKKKIASKEDSHFPNMFHFKYGGKDLLFIIKLYVLQFLNVLNIFIVFLHLFKNTDQEKWDRK